MMGFRAWRRDPRATADPCPHSRRFHDFWGDQPAPQHGVELHLFDGWQAQGCRWWCAAVIGRGWGQGAQHSKSLFSNFNPHSRAEGHRARRRPSDMKGNADRKPSATDNPVICFEHRWLYWGRGGRFPKNRTKIPARRRTHPAAGPKNVNGGRSVMDERRGAPWRRTILQKARRVRSEIIDPRATPGAARRESDRRIGETDGAMHHRPTATGSIAASAPKLVGAHQRRNASAS